MDGFVPNSWELFIWQLAPWGQVNNLSNTTWKKNCFSPSDWSQRKIWTSSARTSRSLVSNLFGGLSTPLTILHRVYIAMCGFLLVILSPHWQEQLARQWLCACIPLFQFLSLLLLNSRFHGGALVRSGRMTMALIFKGVRLVNAFISMYTKESIISALLHSSNKLLHNFHTNLLFYSHYFWFFIFFFPESVSLCFALTKQLGQRSGWSWRGFSVLHKDTWADWVIATVGLEPSYGALQPRALTVDMNFKVSVLHGIFLSCTFVLGFS